MNRIKKYIRIWWIFSRKTNQLAFVSRAGAIIFICGKLLRLLFFVFFIFLLFSKTKALGGYTFWDIVLFYLTFSFIDSVGQFLLREVYRFRAQVVNGNFDYYLLRPVSPLFRSLFSGADILDIPNILIITIFLIITFTHIPTLTFVGSMFYFLLIVNALIISLSFHIAVLALGILTTEVDNAIMFYRDTALMGRIPVDVYKQPLRGFLTFIVPIGIMMTFPAQALPGILSYQFIFLSFCIGGLCIFLSLRLWSFALKNYTSASS